MRRTVVTLQGQACKVAECGKSAQGTSQYCRGIGGCSGIFLRPLEPADEFKAQHFTAEARLPILDLREKLATVEWDSHAIHDAIKNAATAHGMKLPKVAMPLRGMVTGTAQTPSINAVLELLGREETLKRMDAQLAGFPPDFAHVPPVSARDLLLGF